MRPCRSRVRRSSASSSMRSRARRAQRHHAEGTAGGRSVPGRPRSGRKRSISRPIVRQRNPGAVRQMRAGSGLTRGLRQGHRKKRSARALKVLLIPGAAGASHPPTIDGSPGNVTPWASARLGSRCDTNRRLLSAKAVATASYPLVRRRLDVLSWPLATIY